MRFKFIIFSITLLYLTACTNNSAGTETYSGSNLIIGVIGKHPEVRENNITFISIELKDLKEQDQLEKFDAVFIMKEHLIEAANDEYVESYQAGIVPFFFIESEKSYLPFVVYSSSYKGTPNAPTKDYATGYYNNPNGEMKYWGYGLYDDVRSKNNITDVYTRIFKTIDEINKTILISNKPVNFSALVLLPYFQ